MGDAVHYSRTLNFGRGKQRSGRNYNWAIRVPGIMKSDNSPFLYFWEPKMEIRLNCFNAVVAVYKKKSDRIVKTFHRIPGSTADRMDATIYFCLFEIEEKFVKGVNLAEFLMMFRRTGMRINGADRCLVARLAPLGQA